MFGSTIVTVLLLELLSRKSLFSLFHFVFVTPAFIFNELYACAYDVFAYVSDKEVGDLSEDLWRFFGAQ